MRGKNKMFPSREKNNKPISSLTTVEAELISFMKNQYQNQYQNQRNPPPRVLPLPLFNSRFPPQWEPRYFLKMRD